MFKTTSEKLKKELKKYMEENKLKTYEEFKEVLGKFAKETNANASVYKHIGKKKYLDKIVAECEKPYIKGEKLSSYLFFLCRIKLINYFRLCQHPVHR